MNFELIKTLLSFMDPHLSIVILEFYEDKENQIFDLNQIHKEKHVCRQKVEQVEPQMCSVIFWSIKETTNVYR